MSGNTKDLLSPMAGLILPGGQALLSGFVTGIIAGALADLADAPDPLPWALLTAGGVSLWAWASGLRWWRDAVAPALAARPTTYQQTTRVELVQNAGSPYLWVDYLDLPVGRESMQAAAVDLIAKNYQTSNLGGARKALTRSEGEALRDYLIARGLAIWRRPGSPTVGWELLAGGRALVNKFAASPPPAGNILLSGARLQRSLHTHTNAHRSL